jgi:hypothetical protein
LRAHLIIMGLHSPGLIGITSRLSWTTGYEVVCLSGHQSRPECNQSFRKDTLRADGCGNHNAAFVGCRFDPHSRVGGEVVDENVTGRRPDE